ncbi:MAG TPA: ATP-binding protein, partial [Candidatus Tectomicrobia bacterium]|nr:ATP-binding protein [Candidatus Tectomicrobia bacterium]
MDGDLRPDAAPPPGDPAAPLWAALEAARMGVWEWTIATGAVRWSTGLEAIHGLAPGAFAGTFEAFQEDIHPDDRARVLAEIRRAVDARGEHRIEYRVVRPGGEVRWVEGRGRVVCDADGTPVRMLGVCMEVTERKVAERAHARRRREAEVIAELTRAINASLDLDTILERVCVGARDLCGSDTATIALPDEGGDAMVVRARVSVSGRPQPVRRIERGKGMGGWVMEHGRPFRTGDYARDPRIGKEYLAGAAAAGVVAALAVPIHIEGRVGGLLYVTNTRRQPFTDEDEAVVTWLADHAAVAIRNARLLASREAALAEAEAANRAKDHFLATLSHELRTPLTAMLGWIRMLRAGKLRPAQVERALEVVERNARLQAQLINDLLDVSRIVAGKLQLELRPVDLVGVIEEALALIRGEAEAGGLALETRFDAAGTAVLGDPLRLQQIVSNLLSNAVKFTPAGGRITIALERVGGFARLSVTDTGAGIDPALLDGIFDRFRQADDRSSRTGGLGLGLAIVRHLVELHQGRVHAESAGRGHGATFVVELPALGERRGVAPPARDDTAAGQPWPSLTGVRVLLVDDQEDARALLAVALERCGAAVHDVRSVREALAAL